MRAVGRCRSVGLCQSFSQDALLAGLPLVRPVARRVADVPAPVDHNAGRLTLNAVLTSGINLRSASSGSVSLLGMEASSSVSHLAQLTRNM